MRKPYFSLGDWRRNLLLLAAATGLGLTLPACSGNSDSPETVAEGGGWDRAADSYSQGVITELTEVQPDKWQITAERPAGKEQVAAILKHFDGKVDTLQGQALQQQMQQYSRQNPENQSVMSGGGGGGLMNILMWSGIGYMAGRFLTPQPAAYANPGLLQQNQGWRSQVAQERAQGRSFTGRGFTGARAGSSGIRPSTSVSRSAGRSTFRSTAPAGRSSGFGSRGYGGGRGFGG